MSYIINPYRYGAGDDPPGGDHVEISTSATVEEDMYDSDYKYFVIDSTTSSAFTVTNAGDSAGSDTIEVYLIAGGGGGGSSGATSGVGCGSGGGAGGYLRDLSYDNGGSLDQVYNVTIGGGGDGYDSGASTNGADSVLTPVTSGSAQTAVGGGAGASYGIGAGIGEDGGSGGGGGFTYGYGDGTTGQGYDGGPLGPSTPYATRYTCGGGGGAGEAGSTDAVGHGGDGVQYEWMDDTYNMLGPDGDGYFAGGGAGAQAAGSSAEGGQGGGGANGADGSSGSANSGGGGGGSNSNVANGGTGGNGGSGKVIIRWKYQN